MKRILLISLALLCCISLFACKKENELENAAQLDLSKCYTAVLSAAEGKTLFVQFEMLGGGSFVIELLPEYAPETVANFQNLVESGFYNGLSFHRISSGFMIQGGDPDGDGNGSSEQSVIGEFASNGFTQNTLPHKRGVISMARRPNDPNSASCQFFIVHHDSDFLDGDYAAFGRVVVGMETVDAIAALPVTYNTVSREKSQPVNTPYIERATFVEYTGKENNFQNAATLDPLACYTTVLSAAKERTLFVQFKMYGGGSFVVELLPEYAPETVANFQDLVESGFYNGLTFHRIRRGFMIQGGDPNGDGSGSSEQTIKGEFPSNGFTQNTLLHERGVISMARRPNDPNSASCQFFIMHQDTEALDGDYAAFGRVVAGMRTVDAIAALPVDYNPISEEVSQPVDIPYIESAVFVNYTAE